MRKSAVLPLFIAVLLLCTGLAVLDHQFIQVQEPGSPLAAKGFFILQAIILFLMGGSQVSSSISHINESGIIDFHRLTPMPSKVQTIGILLGAPIRELMLYATTLPFSLFCALTGPIGITNWCKLLLVQLGAAVMYYTLAMVTGMSARTGRGASGRFVAVLAFFNIMANTVYPIGIYGPALLTVVPIYNEVFPDELPPGARPNANKGVVQAPGAPANAEPEILFFNLKIPVVFQSLLFQGTFIGFLFAAAARRVRSERLPLFAKPSALLFFGSVSFLSLGSLWDAPRTFQVLGLIYFLTFFGMVLCTTIAPILGDVVKGMQRARKVTNSRVPPWSDLASSRQTVLFFGAIMVSVVALALLSPEKLMVPAAAKPLQPWPSLAVGVCILFWFAFGFQYFRIRRPRQAGAYITGTLIGMTLFPLIGGATFLTSDNNLALLIMAASPIVAITFAGGIDVPLLNQIDIQIAAIAPSAILAAFFFVALLSREKALRAGVTEEHGEPLEVEAV